MRLEVAAAVVIGVAVATSGAGPVGAADTVAECDARVRRAPDDLESYRCYWAVARRTGDYATSRRSLEARVQVDPDDAPALLYLGALDADQGRASARGHYERAAELFVDSGDATGEVYARLALAFALGRRGEGGDLVVEQLDRAGRTATVADDPVLIARVRLARASHDYRRSDLGAAYLGYRRAVRDLQDDAPLDVRSEALGGLAAACWATRRIDRALELYLEQAELLRAAGDRYAEATARSNVALLAQSAERVTTEERRARAREALELARATGNPRAEASALIYVGNSESPERATAYFERAVEVARRSGDTKNLVTGLLRLSNRRLAEDPDDGLAMSVEAVRIARRAGHPERHATAAMAHARRLWVAGTREQALDASMDAIRIVEGLRNLQSDDEVRSGSFGKFAPTYTFAARQLLLPIGRPPDPRDADRAFRILERMRARELLDRLDRSGATPRPTADAGKIDQRARTLAAIASIQRDLLGPMDDDDRAAALAELDRLELREAEQRDGIARADPRYGEVRAVEVPPLDRFQRALGPRRAAIAFQFGDDDEPFAMVITEREVRTYALPARRGLVPKLGFLRALLAQRELDPVPLARDLYDDLLAAIVDDLPAGVDRLLIAPDRDLHRLPFGLLLAAGGRDGLDPSVVPSFTTWTRWQRRPAPGGRDSLVLADPVVDASRSGEHERAFVSGATGGLGALPYARLEARSIARSARASTLTAVGPEASEALVKRLDLSRFGVVHVAAHALVDDRRPRRSGIVLAPGGADEDGLLQPAEISTLDLSDAVVVLSACGSANGRVVRGEGVVGLAHALFQARARAVVGNLWPVRDDDAARFVEAVYERLGRGESVARAVSGAQARMRSAGWPPAAWAGFVVLGDGDVVPFSGRPAPVPAWLTGVAAAVLAAAAGMLALRVRRESSHRS